MAIELDGSICIILPEEIVIKPNRKTGWETTICQIRQDITRQYYVFGLKLPFRLRIAFSDVTGITIKRSDVPVYRGTTLEEKFRWSLILWNVSERELFVGEERRGFRHDILFATNQGKSIKIVSGTTTWDDLEQGAMKSPGIEKLESHLTQMAGLQQIVPHHIYKSS